MRNQEGLENGEIERVDRKDRKVDRREVNEDTIIGRK